MTKKHFIALAKEISKLATFEARRNAASATARACAVSNPRFNSLRFFAACNAVQDSKAAIVEETATV